MKIEAIKIKNYKVFKELDIRNLPNMCVFLGANGSGKSTFFDIFGFLSQSLRENVKSAINNSNRGGFKEVISRNQTGNIEIEIKFRNESQNNEYQPLITYGLKIELKNNLPIVKSELLKYRRGKRGKPWHFLDFEEGEGTAITNEENLLNKSVKEKREPQKLDSPDILAIKGLGQFQKFKAVSDFRKLLENWYIANFQIPDTKKNQDYGVSEYLTTTGDNLVLVADYIYENHPDIFNHILKQLEKRIPGISIVETTKTEDNRILLRFKDQAFKDPFMARYVSDGTLKMFAYLILLYHPHRHPLLCIEEPENYLYPSLLYELAEEFREYANRGGQVFISTHSPDFVNALQPKELFWLTKKNGYTTMKRASDDELINELYEAGDQLGSLWNQGHFKDSDPQ